MNPVQHRAMPLCESLVRATLSAVAAERATCATLLLQTGVAPNVVQRRLGHKKIEITLTVYAHALPAMQQDAAARLAAVLH